MKVYYDDEKIIDYKKRKKHQNYYPAVESVLS